MEERRKEKPCKHTFNFFVPMEDGTFLNKCCSCDWQKIMSIKPRRETDWTYEQFKERQRAEGEA
jgi:hypothetical protein